MAQTDRCNNVTDCADRSDEANCQTEVTTAGVSPTSDTSMPLITVTCTESQYLPPVTTTPTTTSTTTTTTSQTLITEITPTTHVPMSNLISTISPSSDDANPLSFITPTAVYNTTGIVQTDTHPHPDSIPPWIIPVSIVIAFVVLIAVAVLIYYMCLKDKNSSENGDMKSYPA